MSLLHVAQLRGGYGGGDILDGVSLEADANEIVVIIGPNGAGKSTLMKAVFGLATTRAGSITFDGTEITGRRPDELVPMGLSYVPQERNVFPSLSVAENLDMGAFIRHDDYRADRDFVFHVFPALAERRKQAAGLMSGGERQMVAIGRALMTRPRLLLLDEPTAGLSPKLVEELFTRVEEIKSHGIGILMVEQNAKRALELADRGYVLVGGRNRFTGTGRELLSDPTVAQAFLGA